MIENEAVRWITDRFRERRTWRSQDLKRAATEAGFSTHAIFKDSSIAALPIRKRPTTTADGTSFWTWTAREGWPLGRDSDPTTERTPVDKINPALQVDAHISMMILDACRASIAAVLDDVQGVKHDVKGVQAHVNSHDLEIATIKEQTRSLEDVARSANWWGGENHETVTTFLKNQRIRVPDGPWHKGGDKSWYWKISCEFGDIIRSLHHDVEHSPRCARKGTGYADFKPWHYPIAWLEEALPIWVLGYGAGRTHWFRHRADLIPQPQNGFSFHEY